MRTRHGCSRFATDRFDSRFVSQQHLASRWWEASGTIATDGGLLGGAKLLDLIWLRR
jgi:hypothetical protein